jgi:hypothetical protein
MSDKTQIITTIVPTRHARMLMNGKSDTLGAVGRARGML